MNHWSRLAWFLVIYLSVGCGSSAEDPEEGAIDAVAGETGNTEEPMIEGGEVAGEMAGSDVGGETYNEPRDEAGDSVSNAGEMVGGIPVGGEERPDCDDGIDNDEDGLADFPQDPGCGSWFEDPGSWIQKAHKTRPIKHRT